jgi:hypothetical protein
MPAGGGGRAVHTVDAGGVGELTNDPGLNPRRPGVHWCDQSSDGLTNRDNSG